MIVLKGIAQHMHMEGLMQLKYQNLITDLSHLYIKI
jgi:hypothetical protein